MGTDYQAIYAGRAEEYDALVAAEDAHGALRAALGGLLPLAGARVVEAGAGTGRLTRILVAAGAQVLATDRSPAMLAVARRHLERLGGSWAVAEADARDLPVESGSCDLALAGWVFGHLRHWHEESWRAEIARALDELRRALRPGGTLVIIETLGTGTEQAAPPNAALAEYYTWLEAEQGCARMVLRTDYDFGTPARAEALTRFFFGDALADRVAREGTARVPECTGLWWAKRA